MILMKTKVFDVGPNNERNALVQLMHSNDLVGYCGSEQNIIHRLTYAVKDHELKARLSVSPPRIPLGHPFL